MEKGYIKTYNWVQGLLKTCDFSDSAKRLGLEQIREDAVLVNFFDRTYEISKDDIALIREKIIWTAGYEGYEFDLKSVLGYYVLSEAETEPLNEYCPLEHFSILFSLNKDIRNSIPLSILCQQRALPIRTQ
jgi:hypothetical protein